MFEIVWSEDAFEQMQRLILLYPHLQQKLSAVLRSINERLSDAPASAGESREGYERVDFFGKVTVYFVVNLKEHIVGITAVYLAQEAF